MLTLRPKKKKKISGLLFKSTFLLLNPVTIILGFVEAEKEEAAYYWIFQDLTLLQSKQHNFKNQRSNVTSF